MKRFFKTLLRRQRFLVQDTESADHKRCWINRTLSKLKIFLHQKITLEKLINMPQNGGKNFKCL